MRYFLPCLLLLIPFLGFSRNNSNNVYISEDSTLEGKGTISGLLTTTDNQPAAGVTVLVKGSRKSVTTAEDGSFTISRLSEGSYELEISLIGHQTINRMVKVTAGKTTVFNIQLELTAQQLDLVVVSGSRGRLTNKETDYVARMPLKNLENPQVYSIVPKELLKDQNAISINGALNNVAGAAPVTYPAGGFGITSRGFLTGINARNGMETVASRSSVDIGNVERIEVIKGPSGTLFGASVASYGGVVNLVTKKPFETLKGEASYSFGSYGLSRLNADFNTPLNEDKTVLFRVNVGVNRQNSFLDYGFNNSTLVAPSLSFKVNEKLTITADAEFYSVTQTRNAYTRVTAASGITNPAQIKLPYSKSLYMDDANAQSSSPKYFIQAKYQLAPSWTSTTLFSSVNEGIKQSYQYYPTYLSPTSVARSVTIYGPVYNTYTNLQENINGTFYTGRFRHNFLGGLGYRFYHSEFVYSASSKFIDTVNLAGSWSAVSKTRIDQYMLNTGSVIPYPVSDQRTYSAYATDVIDITGELSAMLSLRADRFEYKGTTATNGYKQTSLAPKLGLVYQLIKDQLSVFGNYMSGFQNNGPVTQPGGGQLVPKPIYANQSEGGVKAELLNKKINITASYYYISIDKALRTDADGYYHQDAGQVSKGVEAEVLASPFAGFSLVAGYAYNDNRITKATDKTTEGNKAASAPANVFNFWVSYKFQKTALKNFGLGCGGNYVDKAYLSTANTYWMPQYTVFNATAFYDQPKWRLGLSLNNLAGRKYWDLYGAPLAPANIVGNLTFRF